MPECPYCAAEVPASAETCPGCGSTIESALVHPPIKAKVSALATTALWLGVAGLLFVIAAIAAIAASLIASVSFGAQFEGSNNSLRSALMLMLYASPVLGLSGIVAAIIARKQLKGSSGNPRGNERAWIGLIAGILGILTWALIVPGNLRSPVMEGSPPVTLLLTVNRAAEEYRVAFHHGYPESLSLLGGRMATTGLAGPPNGDEAELIDAMPSSGHKSGLVITYKVTARDENNFPTAYAVTVAPVTGCRKDVACYFTDQTTTIRVKSGGLPDQTSPALRGPESWKAEAGP